MNEKQTTAMRPNVATDEGHELGHHLSRFADQELVGRRDDRCQTCAFRSGDHIANGSPETLMNAFKCVMEREPFWCHEHDRPCAGWKALVVEKGCEVPMPWDYIGGSDL